MQAFINANNTFNAGLARQHNLLVAPAPWPMPITTPAVFAIPIRSPTDDDIYEWSFAQIDFRNIIIRVYIPWRFSDSNADFIDGVFYELRHKDDPLAAEEREVDVRGLESLVQMCEDDKPRHKWRPSNMDAYFTVISRAGAIGFPIIWKRLEAEDEPLYGAIDVRKLPPEAMASHTWSARRGPTGGDLYSWAFALIRFWDVEIRLYIPIPVSEMEFGFVQGVLFEIRHCKHPFAAEEDEVDVERLKSLVQMDGEGQGHRWGPYNMEEIFEVVTERATIGFSIMWKMKAEDEPVFGRVEARRYVRRCSDLW